MSSITTDPVSMRNLRLLFLLQNLGHWDRQWPGNLRPILMHSREKEISRLVWSYCTTYVFMRNTHTHARTHTHTHIRPPTSPYHRRFTTGAGIDACCAQSRRRRHQCVTRSMSLQPGDLRRAYRQTLFLHGFCLVKQMSMRTRTRHFHLLSKQWSCELGLGFSLRVAPVHTHHIHSRNMQTPCRKRVDRAFLAWCRRRRRSTVNERSLVTSIAPGCTLFCPLCAFASVIIATAPFSFSLTYVGVDLAGILGGRMASAEVGSVQRGVGYGEGCPFRSRPGGLGERRQLPQRRPRRRSLISEFVKAFKKAENFMSSLESS